MFYRTCQNLDCDTDKDCGRYERCDRKYEDMKDKMIVYSKKCAIPRCNTTKGTGKYVFSLHT